MYFSNTLHYCFLELSVNNFRSNSRGLVLHRSPVNTTRAISILSKKRYIGVPQTFQFLLNNSNTEIKQFFVAFWHAYNFFIGKYVNIYFHINDKKLDASGGLSVAVPGELRGYWQLYNKFGGGVPWKDLVQPTIEMCKNGIYVTSFLDSVFKTKKEILYADPVLR